MVGRKTRPQRAKDGVVKERVHPIGTPSGMSPNTGPLATASWLIARDLVPQPAKWFVTITFASRDGAKLDLEILSEEWGFRFERHDRVSWIRVTDIAFAHGHDDHELLPHTPKLRDRWPVGSASSGYFTFLMVSDVSCHALCVKWVSVLTP